jgi:hypothetical protein
LPAAAVLATIASMRASVLLIAMIFGLGCGGNDPAPPALVSDGGSPDGGDGGTKMFGDDCMADSECASNVCFTDATRMYCSEHCTMSASCPPPYDCTAAGFCRAP